MMSLHFTEHPVVDFDGALSGNNSFFSGIIILFLNILMLFITLRVYSYLKSQIVYYL